MDSRVIVYEQPGPPREPQGFLQTSPGNALGPLFPLRLPHAANPIRLIQFAGHPTLHNYLTTTQPKATIYAPELDPGCYYPRIWRGAKNFPIELESVPPLRETEWSDTFSRSLEQIEALCDSMLSLFRTIHPEGRNLRAYGGAIRNLLILACTEIEAQWRGVLEANAYASPRAYWNTRDYIKLLPAMSLSDYSLSLLRYPGLSSIAPFANWNLAGGSTTTLRWYNAYNKVKHCREKAFPKATLKHAIKAVGACIIMVAAQFGAHMLEKYQFRNPFGFVDTPQWEPAQ